MPHQNQVVASRLAILVRLQRVLSPIAGGSQDFSSKPDTGGAYTVRPVANAIKR